MAGEKKDDLEYTAPENVGTLWRIPHFNRSGLFSTVYANSARTAVLHYVRNETKYLWEILEEGRNSEYDDMFLIKIHGDPGSGKSSTLWGYCMFLSSQTPIAWVTQRKTGYHLAWATPEDAPNHQQYAFSQFDELADAIMRLQPTFVVLDGIVETKMATTDLSYMIQHLMDIMSWKWCLAVCSSLQSETKYSGAYLSGKHQLFWFVDGWSLEDVCAARKTAIKYNQPVLPAPLLNKADDTAFRRQLHIAGGSMRYLMEHYGTVEQELLSLIRARNWTDLLQAARSGSDTYNRLFVHSNHGEYTHLLSEFIYKEISKLVPMEELDRAAALDPENNAFLGTLFEIRGRRIFEDAVAKKQAVTFTKTKILSLSETFYIARLVDYSEAEGDGPAHLQFCTQGYIPVKRNQGCFDFVLIRRNKDGKYHVYFLQYTVSDHHDALMQYAAKFLRKMFPNNLTSQVQTRAHKRARTTSFSAEASPLLVQGAKPQAGGDFGEGMTHLELSAEEDLRDEDSPVPPVATDVFPAMVIQVHFYFVLPRDRVKKFNLRSCNIEDIESVQNFDPEFRADKIRVAFISSHKT